MRDEKEMRWRTLSSETLIARPWLTARRDKVELPDGSIYDEYYVLHYPTWINVIAETEDGRLILERQYRHALDVVSMEICAGVVEKGETPLEGAQRELQEETGYIGGEWTELMTIAPNSSPEAYGRQATGIWMPQKTLRCSAEPGPKCTTCSEMVSSCKP